MFGRALARAEASFANLGRHGWSVQPSALGRDAFLEYTDSIQTAAPFRGPRQRPPRCCQAPWLSTIKYRRWLRRVGGALGRKKMRPKRGLPVSTKGNGLSTASTPPQDPTPYSPNHGILRPMSRADAFARCVATIDSWAGHCPESMITIVLSTREGFATSPGTPMRRSQRRQVVAAAKVVGVTEEADSSQVEHFEMVPRRNIINDPYVGN
jgi:hypothetical protein